ncbi:hypothetical protein ACHHYP_07164 [Achlya hypogyna]|uniref:Uncharacterized protein n=1 Tax=Achlya hypogyna TaxID=1202772 RepID=A0A1V9ZMH2_ACHHY|nr:hypothetical protein ACHHYP_07164 [Achlya hypogyna]
MRQPQQQRSVRVNYDGDDGPSAQRAPPASKLRRPSVESGQSMRYSFIEAEPELPIAKSIARRMVSMEHETRFGRNEYLSLRPQVASKLPTDARHARRPMSQNDTRMQRPTIIDQSTEEATSDMLSQFQAIRNRTDPAVQARMDLQARLTEAVQRIPLERLPSSPSARPKTPKSRKKVRFIE